MTEEIERVISELEKQKGTWPKMWTSDVIRLLEHLREFSKTKVKENLLTDVQN